MSVSGLEEAQSISKQTLASNRFFDLSISDSCKVLRSDATIGLPSAAIAERKAIFGPNQMTSGSKPSFLHKLWEQVANILIVILIAAAIVGIVMQDWVEVIFIAAVIVINVSIGLAQEAKAEKAAEALSKLLSASAVVVRDGSRKTVEAVTLVCGDVIFLDPGARVPADARLVDATNLCVMEAMLTGESVPATKEADVVLPTDTPLADRHNMIYAGTLVTGGQCLALVTSTGDLNEIGKINSMVSNVQAGKTPLLAQIEQFGKWLSGGVIFIAFLTFLLEYLVREVDVGESLTTGITVAVALIPEGLPSVLTIILALGVSAMAKRNAIIRQLPAVETLGSVSVICSDKTGTLTRNEMTAVELRTTIDNESGNFRITGQGFSPDGFIKQGDAHLVGNARLKVKLSLLPAVLCNDASLSCDRVPPSHHVQEPRFRGTGSSPPPHTNIDVDLAEKGDSTHKKSHAHTHISPDSAPVSSTKDTHNSTNVNVSAAYENDFSVFWERSRHQTHTSTFYGEGAEWTLTGDPTEGALLVIGMKAGWRTQSCVYAPFPRISTIPFDSDHKFMATLHDIEVPGILLYPPGDQVEVEEQKENSSGKKLSAAKSSTERSSATLKRRLMLVKGAPDRLISRCARQSRGGNPFITDSIDRDAWLERSDSLSAEGLRVLALAICDMPNTTASISLNDVMGGEPNLTLTALVGIVDPPREECIAAVKECHEAGVRVAMITGDSPLTAEAIGGWLGIDTSEVLTGTQMQAMNDDELADHVKDCNIYARATPEHKLRIVRALQGRYKYICAMTGDGVNDAAALKASNCGIAMGITGTEVAKEASEMVLADDNFATIVHAIQEGRRVYDNLRKVLIFVLPTNFSQGISILAATIIGMPHPFNAKQILYVNMMTSVTLGIVLSFEKAEQSTMKRPPRRSGKPIVGKLILWKSLFVGLILVVIVLGNMEWELQRQGYAGTTYEDKDDNPEDYDKLKTARSVAMTTLLVGQAVYIFNCRYLRSTSLRWDIIYGNPYVMFSSLINVGLQALIIYTPGVQDVFEVADIDGLSWLRCLLFGAALFLIVELDKIIGPKHIRPFVKSFLSNIVWCIYRYDDTIENEGYTLDDSLTMGSLPERQCN